MSKSKSKSKSKRKTLSGSGSKVPLFCGIRGQKLVIEIGIDTLAYAIVAGSDYPVNVTNAMQFAKDVASELDREDESGESAVHRLLDKAGLDAVENGSLGATDETD